MVHPGPSPSNLQLTQRLPNSVLLQRGPSSLPYAEETKWLIRQHLLAIATGCPSLESKTAFFTHNDGRTVNLLQADGTIPMPFRGVTYDVPVVIWLMESYPRHPPASASTPRASASALTPPASGLVSVPYLHNWVYPSSNLVDLVRNLSLVFARAPPLYSRRRPHHAYCPKPEPEP